MVVGDPLGGKTSALKTLAGALATLHSKGLMEENAVRIHIHFLLQQEYLICNHNLSK